MVADEVKQLANRTKETAESVDQVLSTFSHQVTEVSRITQESQALSNGMHELVSGFEQQFTQLAKSSCVSALSVDGVGTVIYHALIKLFTSKTAVALHAIEAGHEHEAASVDQTMCRMGKWYYGEARGEAYSRSEAFKRLEQPHQQVHNSVHAAIEQVDSNWESDAQIRNDIVDSMRSAERDSEQVMYWVNQLTEERLKQMHEQIKNV